MLSGIDRPESIEQSSSAFAFKGRPVRSLHTALVKKRRRKWIVLAFDFDNFGMVIGCDLPQNGSSKIPLPRTESMTAKLRAKHDVHRGWHGQNQDSRYACASPGRSAGRSRLVRFARAREPQRSRRQILPGNLLRHREGLIPGSERHMKLQALRRKNPSTGQTSQGVLASKGTKRHETVWG